MNVEHNKKRVLIRVLVSSYALICLFISLPAVSGTVSKTNTENWSVDDSTDSRSVTFVSGVDAHAGATVDDVNISVEFDKSGDDVCPVDNTNNFTFNSEIRFALIKDGTTVALVNLNQFNGSNGLPVINMTFDSDSANPPDGGSPNSGTFRPVGNLDDFDTQLIAGTWSLEAEDNVAIDPLCINSFTVEITFEQASLSIVKTVTNDDGGTGEVDDFNITSSAGTLDFGAGVPSGSDTVYTATTLTINPGSYSLIEDDLAEYTEGNWSCSDGTGLVSTFNAGSITLADGDNAICSISNNDELSNVDLSIIKTVDVDEPVVGSTVTFTLTVSNAAGGGDATAVEVVDIIPPGFTFVSGSMLGGDVRDESDPTGVGLQWTINSLAAGAAPVVLTFQATVNSP